MKGSLIGWSLVALLSEAPKYKALDHRTGEWRKCRVIVKPKGGRHKGPRNCLILFEGDREFTVRPWRGIKRDA